MGLGVCGFAGSTAASANAVPSAPFPPYWYRLNVTSSPCDVGTLVLANTPPSWLWVALVNLSLPEPWESVDVGQLASGVAVEFPAAERQAVLVPVGAAGSDTHPAGPAPVRPWNGWLN